MTSQEIRQKFLDFFKEKGHEIVPSAPLVLKNDPTLMFINSGMAQFKDYFLGYKKPSSVRITDTQKCLRVSGKHNDLDDVGRDTYHHTMFEMLGNWSFGDYFKKEAIAWAWELLTEVYGISKDDLYVTIFEGDASENLERDQEAYDAWKQHISEDRIINGNKHDNFWEMGDTGPCGPCSEIHVDLRSAEEKAKTPGKELVNHDDPRVVEVWNLVFMEFQRKADGALEKLPKKNVDTGMGFERLCMALQGKESNYDTDVFAPLIRKVEEISGKQYTGSLKSEKDTAIRVVVDHIRAVAFAIADGQLPANNGAGYVIRRILRRAISYAYRFLGIKEPFLYELVIVLKDEMGDFFPEIIKQEKLIKAVIKEEEESFLNTIERGLVRLNAIIGKTVENGQKLLPGAEVFELYDTYGFPDDLSRIIAEEKGLGIDHDGFNAEMAKQKERSKKSAASKTYDWVILHDEPQEFVGWDQTENKVKILRYREITNKDGDFYQIVLDKTPFYAEGGGQVGDTGILKDGEEEIEVLDTKKENNLNMSLVARLPIQIEDDFIAQVDKDRRQNNQHNHSATHLLDEALRQVLGKHVEQRGSYVGPDYLRFDFSYFSKMSDEEIAKVEQQVNERIRKNIPLQEHRNIPIEEAKSKGAIALFGEKYGNHVRMIQFGTSKELCGGTHVKSTGEIGIFKILSEGSAAAGIRRIEAITGDAARNYYANLETKYQEIAQLLKSKDPLKSVEKLLDENRILKSEIEGLKSEKAQNEVALWTKEFQNSNGKKLLVKKTSLDAKAIKDIIFILKQEVQNSVTVLLSDHGEKPLIAVGVSKDLENTFHAGNIVKDLAKEIQGGGGGNAGFATAGGKDLTGLKRVMEKAKTL